MTAWLLTWLWQGSALAAGVAVALRCAPRVNAATRHLIWCAALAAVAWLGLGQFTVPGSASSRTCASGGRPHLHSFSARLPYQHLRRHLGSGRAGESAASAAGLRAVYALRDRCRPFPPSIESRLPLWLEAKARGRRTTLMICDAVPGATVLGFHASVHRHSVVARRGADGRRARSGDSSRACARAAARRLVAARADAVAVGAVDSSGGAVRVARVEPRARDGVRRMGRRADRSAEGVCEMPRARCRSARADERRPDAGARAHRRPPRARAARRSPAGHTRPGAAERVACRCDHARRARW